ncbi:MAG: galactose oxidase-like domain-containing protein [Gemmatimonadota bacterium]
MNPAPITPGQGPTASIAAIRFTTLCGTTYSVLNGNATKMYVAWAVVGTTEKGTLSLPATPPNQTYTESRFKTAHTGTVRLTYNSTSIGSAQSSSTACALQSTAGAWSPVNPWPVIPIDVAVLPNGNLLAWGHAGNPYLWNPSTGTFTSVPAPTDVFCAGHNFLPDGRLLVAGGNITDGHGLATANIFDFRTDQWTAVPRMKAGRWYPTNTALANGEQLVIAGDDSAGNSNRTPEVWQTGGGWRELTTAKLSVPEYPWMFVSPSGRVINAGPDPRAMYLNTAGTGSWSSGPVSQFGYRDYGAAAMYDGSKLIVVGGGLTPTNTAEILDLRTTNGWKYTGSMSVPRRLLNATMLPDGTMLVTGGTSGSGFNNLSGAEHAAELWSPVTGKFTSLASANVERLYHSVALLLPDGRVLTGGGGDPVAAGATNQPNTEIFSPPYLFDPDGRPATRPVISSAPTAVGYGQTFLVGTPSAASVNAVTLVSLPSTTHGFNQNMRLIRLPFSISAGNLTITTPASPNLAPPGYYMLFLVNPEGTPSIAQIVKVG